MALISPEFVSHLVETYGAGLVGVASAAECIGIPLPAEAALVAAAVYAGSTGRLSITAVVLAAAAGAIIGQMIGYLIGRTAGAAALKRWGGMVGLTEDRLLLGRYLFRHHGGKVILLGRFVALLRTLGALLAGSNAMPWSRFMTANIVGGILWAALYGYGADALGTEITRFAGPGATILGILAIIAVIAALRAVRRSERQLIAKARAEEAIRAA